MCQETIPQTLGAFFEAASFEETTHNAISIGESLTKSEFSLLKKYIMKFKQQENPDEFIIHSNDSQKKEKHPADSETNSDSYLGLKDKNVAGWLEVLQDVESKQSECQVRDICF